MEEERLSYTVQQLDGAVGIVLNATMSGGVLRATLADDTRIAIPADVIVTPTVSISVGGTEYDNIRTVTLSPSVNGAQIYYTTDGSTPTTESNLYSEPFDVEASTQITVTTTTVRAIAVYYGETSIVAEQTVTTRRHVATPEFTPSGNVVTISCDTPDATIYYTTNGDTPTTASTQYTGAVTLDASSTLKAIAVLQNWQNSVVTSQAYYVGYYGASSLSAMASLDNIKTLTPMMSTSANHYKKTYTFAVSAGQYVYWCIPSNKTISKVTSSGFEVPVHAQTSVSGWNCYRNGETDADAPVSVAGTYTYVVS